MHVLIYEHRHGHDVFFCETRDAAERVRLQLVIDNVDELLSEHRDEVLTLIQTGDFSAAVTAFCTHNEEGFEVIDTNTEGMTLYTAAEQASDEEFQHQAGKLLGRK